MRLLLAVAALTLSVLVLTAGHQIYDTNFYSLWEATALAAGDHPYRDFFEWGIPLQAVVSLAGQVVSGHRLIGEFALQWSGIIAGAVIAFHLGLRMSRSVPASLVMFAIALLVTSSTALYHYPKLLFYPLALWLIWRYVEQPGSVRAAAMGVVTAAAFLFRHDHGVYVAIAAAVAFGLMRLVRPESRSVRAALVESGVGAATTLALLAPWVVLVLTNEGLRPYIQSRLERYAVGSAYSNPYASILSMNPLPILRGSASRDEAVLWLQQAALLVPIVLALSALARAISSWRRREPVPLDVYRLAAAAFFLGIVFLRQFREPGYVGGVAPLAAALAAPFLVPSRRWQAVVALPLVVTTALAAVLFARQSEIFTPWRLAGDLPDVFRQLTASPPIDGYVTRDQMSAYDASNWNAEQVHAVEVMTRYLHDCTRDGDRVLVTGQTPFQVGYYVDRPIAGGHLFWHERWRSGTLQERQSLRLLQAQSVPFAYSTHDPVLDDLRPYPNIREYVNRNYVELEGSRGLLLVDRRRRPTGTFARLGFPCFR